MVNASLNWASIVGIVLAICGAGLYFMRSFKPALARDYDVFFAAIGLLCGGILFFQGWRLDPILQFGQFLLAGTTVFFAYESVRLRGVATDQARRSSYFEESDSPRSPGGGLRGRQWDDDPYDRFDEPQPINRRFSSRDELGEDDSQSDPYQPRRASRAAIPEEAASRRFRPRNQMDNFEDNPRRRVRANRSSSSEYSSENRSNFGERRNTRQELRRGTRPSASQRTSKRAQSQVNDPLDMKLPSRRPSSSNSPRGTRIEDAAFSSRDSRKLDPRKNNVDKNSKNSSIRGGQYGNSRASKNFKDKNNNSRFDD